MNPDLKSYPVRPHFPLISENMVKRLTDVLCIHCNFVLKSILHLQFLIGYLHGLCLRQIKLINVQSKSGRSNVLVIQCIVLSGVCAGMFFCEKGARGPLGSLGGSKQMVPSNLNCKYRMT